MKYSPPPDTIDLEQYKDACPKCTSLAGMVTPLHCTLEGDGIKAWYLHRRCGHRWTCAWQMRTAD
jgi:hypothetical protein